MAWNALFIASFAAFTAALLPPCLPGLGLEFCPSTVPHDTYKVSHEPFRYPDLTQQDDVAKVFERLNKTRMEVDLRALTDPKELPNRLCTSSFGQRTHKHVVDAVEKIMTSQLGNHSFTVPNTTPQLSYVARILATGSDPKGPSSDQDTIVVGAHMDSFNHEDKYDDGDKMVAPGADDNGTGTVVLMEVLRALIPLFTNKRVKNEVQFHWYAAEEVGLLGSRSIFNFYRGSSSPVKAMLNLDMVGYSGGHEAEFPIIAVQTDEFVDEGLTTFTRELIEEYTEAEPSDAKCGYACSDHASAHGYGYPSAMIGESSYVKGKNDYPFIHTANDTIDHVDFDYMLEFAKVTAAFVVELAYADFDKL